MSEGSVVDLGIILGSGIYGVSGGEPLLWGGRFGEVEVEVLRVGPWRVGVVSRHGEGHYHLSSTVAHRTNLTALKGLGARAVVSTTSVGVVDAGAVLGRPIIFEDLYFPENRLPGGELCTVFPEPGEPERGHAILSEPFSPRLRERMVEAAAGIGVEVEVGGVYAHTNGPRFETKVEIRALKMLGISAVSQTCGPEAVLAGELELPYALVGFPVNYATGVAAAPESEGDKGGLDLLLALSAEILPRLAFKTVELLTEDDLGFDHGYVYRVEGGVGKASD